jgi:hypothetical protein
MATPRKNVHYLERPKSALTWSGEALFDDADSQNAKEEPMARRRRGVWWHTAERLSALYGGGQTFEAESLVNALLSLSIFQLVEHASSSEKIPVVSKVVSAFPIRIAESVSTVHVAALKASGIPVVDSVGA